MLLKKISVLALFVLLILLSFSFVSAWGVIPAKQLAEFTENSQNLHITLRNNNFDEGFFKVSFAGELADHITYDSEALVYLSPSDADILIPFTLKLGSGLLPGKNVTKVIVQQIPASESGETLSSVLTLVAEVVVNVPYEGNYILAQLEVGQVGQNKPVPFTISVLNKGEEAVSIWVDVVIKGPTNAELFRYTTNKQMLGYLVADKIETFWNEDKEPGLYFAEVIVHYGDKTQVLRKEFVVGEEEIVVQSMRADKFILGEINQLILTSQNKWNAPIVDVFAEVFVLTKDGRTVQSFKSTSENFGPYETKELKAFWDTSNLVVGEYTLQTLVQVSGATNKNQFPVIVSIDTVNFAPSGHVVSGGSSASGSESTGGISSSLLIILLIVVVITNVIIIMYFRRSKKK